MFEILELLYDYSMHNKILDREFIDRVLVFYWNGLKGYLESVRYCDIEQPKDFPDFCVPAGYSYLNKRINIDEKVIQKFFPYKMFEFQRSGMNEFGRIFTFNVELLRTLLHEIDHALQYKKGSENADSFEGLLLFMCFYPEIEVLGRSNLKRYMYLRFRLINRTNLGHMYHDFSKEFNLSFGVASPYERLAQIDSGKQVLGLLDMFDSDIKKIPDVLRYFKYQLLYFYMEGYDKTKEEQAPTLRYIQEIRNLGYSKLNKIASSVESRLGEITLVDDKIKYGLNVTDREISEFKRIMLK